MGRLLKKIVVGKINDQFYADLKNAWMTKFTPRNVKIQNPFSKAKIWISPMFLFNNIIYLYFFRYPLLFPYSS